MPSYTLSLLLLAMSLFACGKAETDKVPNKRPPGIPTIPQARSAAEALSWLSPEDRQSFEAWKTSLIKECSVHSIFPMGPESWANESPDEKSSQNQNKPFVDSYILRTLTGNSPIVHSANFETTGEFVILGDPTPSRGSEGYRIESLGIRPGSMVRGLSAASRKDNSSCVITLFGHPVFQTELVVDIPVIAHFSQSRQDHAIAIGPFGIQSDGTFFKVNSDLLTRPVLDALSPTSEAFSTLLFKLKVPKDQLTKVVQLKSWPAQVTILPITPFGLSPVNLEFPEFIGHSDAFRPLMVAGTHYFDLEWIISTSSAPSFQNFFALRTSSTLSRWNTNIRIRAQMRFDGNSRSGGKASVTGLELMGEQDAGPRLTEAADCFSERLDTLIGLWSQQKQVPRFPTFREISSPCAVLTRTPSDLLFAAPEIKKEIVYIIDNLVNSKRLRNSPELRDWLDTFVYASADLIIEDKNPADMIDPQKGSAIIQKSVAQAMDLYHQAKGELPPSNTTFLKDLAVLSLQSSFSGFELDTVQRAALIASIIKAGDILPNSLRTLFINFPKAPTAYLPFLRYTMALTPQMLEKVETLKTLSFGLELNDWITTISNGFIQNTVSEDTLNKWLITLNAGTAFASRDQLRGASPIHFDSQSFLLQRALVEGWTHREFETLEKIVPMSGNLVGCDSYLDVSSLSLCVGWSKISAAPGKILDPRFKARYIELASRLKKSISSLPRSLFDLRYNISKRFWDPLWGTCPNNLFGERLDTLETLISTLLKDPNPSLGNRAVLKIESILADCASATQQ